MVGIVSRALMLVAAGHLFVLPFGSRAAAQDHAALSVWRASNFSTARLIGVRTRDNGEDVIWAGVEISLEPGWKTYWRRPGDAGGVPPTFNWSYSSNVASTEVLYPAPSRIVDFGGATIGYEHKVVFPVRVVPVVAGEPVDLKLNLSYGICGSICIPLSAKLSVRIDEDASGSVPQSLRAALDNVPVAGCGSGTRATVPRLAAHSVVLDGAAPRIELTGVFPDSGSPSDMFVDVGGGDVFVPMPRRRPQKGPGVYEIDLRRVPDRAELKGQSLSIVLVSSAGHCIETIDIH